MKNTKSIILLIFCFISLSAFITIKTSPENPQEEYGVFLGIDEKEASKMNNYRLVVVEPSEFSSDKLKTLHASGKKVYAYLNIGAIEEYRPYYSKFQNLTLGRYENWQDEKWINVSVPTWRNFLVKELAKASIEKGFDGFFLDNFDVYYHYPTDEIFQGLCTILKDLKNYNVPLILNGGDYFVTKCINENTALSLFDGINQETVFTRIDFDNKTYHEQENSETKYFQDYLLNAKKAGLRVYLLEYGANQKLSKKIDLYCKENGFYWYNAKSLALQ